MRTAPRRALAGAAAITVLGLGLASCGDDDRTVGNSPAFGDERAGTIDDDTTTDGDTTDGGTTDDDSDGDGTIEEGTRLTAFDTDHVALANLDPELLDAVQQATEAAERDGIELLINSGWRSADKQQRLLDEAIDTYGSIDEARRWVSTPGRSKHVTGEAVDVGPWDAAEWLDEHGDAWGLCRIYDNEPWHFELAAEPGGSCPRLLFDASEG